MVVRATNSWDLMPTALFNLVSEALHNHPLATSSPFCTRPMVHHTKWTHHQSTTWSSFRFLLITFSLTHSPPMLSEIFFFFLWLISNVISSVKLSLKLQDINSFLCPPKFFEPGFILDLITLSCNFFVCLCLLHYKQLKKATFFPFCTSYRMLEVTLLIKYLLNKTTIQ